MNPGGAREVDEVELSSATCWILGAGASYDCIGESDFCVPLTFNLIRKEAIADALRAALTPFIERALLSATDFDDAVGRNLETTVDELRALTNHPNPATRREAAAGLAELIRTVAAMVSVGSVPAMYYDTESSVRRITHGWHTTARNVQNGLSLA